MLAITDGSTNSCKMPKRCARTPSSTTPAMTPSLRARESLLGAIVASMRVLYWSPSRDLATGSFAMALFCWRRCSAASKRRTRVLSPPQALQLPREVNPCARLRITSNRKQRPCHDLRLDRTRCKRLEQPRQESRCDNHRTLGRARLCPISEQERGLGDDQRCEPEGPQISLCLSLDSVVKDP